MFQVNKIMWYHGKLLVGKNGYSWPTFFQNTQIQLNSYQLINILSIILIYILYRTIFGIILTKFISGLCKIITFICTNCTQLSSELYQFYIFTLMFTTCLSFNLTHGTIVFVKLYFFNLVTNTYT